MKQQRKIALPRYAEYNCAMKYVVEQGFEANCGGCSNNCEIICVYRDGQLIDSWGNRCERGSANLRRTISA